MNIFPFIIITALALEFILNTIADNLNLKALKHEVPTILAEVYKPDEYRKSHEYTVSRTHFGFITSFFSLLIILLFWFMGGFNFLDQIVRSWGFGPITNGLFYIGILLIAYSILTLPFSIYATFVIEERFAFNRTTPQIYIADILKGLALMVVLGGPLLAGVLTLFEYTGTYAWLYCWVAVTVFTIVMQLVAPIWIMPLFNKFSPMESGELKNAIHEYAHSVGYEVGNISVMDGSKRSEKTNAFFTGFGRTKRIALFDTLISKHTAQELVAILAHEIGHYKKKHVLQGIVISIVHTGLIFFLLSILLRSPALYQAFFMDQDSIYAGLIFFGLLYTPVEMILSIALQIVSRRNEYEADRFVVETTTEPIYFVDALKKLTYENLSNLTPHPFYVFLNYSHPPLLQRIQAIHRYRANKIQI
ncbi:M48 family metallopeptidase [Chloroflexota bacterium]